MGKALKPPEVKLSGPDLDRALAFLEHHGVSEFFPEPFEFQAVKENWAKVRPEIEKINVLSYNPLRGYEMMAPKQKYAVRPVKLLDPIDALLYSGLVCRNADKIELGRLPSATDRVFSYRVKHVGNTITLETDFEGLHDKKLEKVATAPFVATADIVDFFPRIYIHRLKNALLTMGIDALDVNAIVRMVEAWAHGTSYGIPIGPLASNLLAEALLVEVDRYLLSHGLDFLRNVDDYTFFVGSEAEGIKALHLLSSRLHLTQNLSLNMAKTTIWPVFTYYTEVLAPKNPDEELRDKIRWQVFGGNPYISVDYDKLTKEQKAIIDQMDAAAILDRALNREVVDLSAVKFVLNVLTALRKPELVDPVLDNLYRLGPVSEAVARFLNVLDDLGADNRTAVGERILSLIRESEYMSDYQRMWLLEPFTHSKMWNNVDDLRVIAREDKNAFVRRQAILAIAMNEERSALLDVKSGLDDAKDWELRAMLYAMRSLPSDERDAVFSDKLARLPGDWRLPTTLDRATLVYAKK